MPRSVHVRTIPVVATTLLVAALTAQADLLRARPDGWHSVAPMHNTRSAFGAALGADGHIYAVGGYSDGGDTATVERYDPRIDQWTPVGALSTPRKFHQVAAIGRHIYAIGGQVAGQSVGTMEIYDVFDDAWVASPHALNTAREEFGMTVDQFGKIYVIGGYDSRHTRLSSVEVFDPRDSAAGWRVLSTSLQHARAALGSGTDREGRVYAIGGHIDPDSGTSSVERLDPADLAAGWQSGPSLNQAREPGGCATTSNGAIHLLGGWRSISGPHLSSVEVYDASGDRWVLGELPDMTRSINSFAAVFDAHGRLYAIGGEHFDVQAAVERIPEPATLMMLTLSAYAVLRRPGR